jgi:hypothetical protein
MREGSFQKHMLVAQPEPIMRSLELLSSQIINQWPSISPFVFRRYRCKAAE